MRNLFSLVMISLAASSVGAAALDQQQFASLTKQGRAALDAGRIAEGEKLYQQACPSEATPAYAPANAAICYHHLAYAAMLLDRGDEAAELFGKAAKAWLAAGPQYIGAYGASTLNLSDLYRQQHLYDQAEQVIVRYLAQLDTGGQPGQGLRPEALSRLALICGDMGRPDKARGIAIEAIAEFDKLPVARPVEAAYAHNTLGLISIGLGLQQDAVTHLRLASETAVKELGENHPETAGYQTNLALALLAAGEVDRAEQLLRHALYVAEKLPGTSDAQRGLIYTELSVVARQRNKLAIAAEDGKKALDLLTHQKWPDERGIAAAQINLAEVYLRARRLDEAEQLFSAAIPTERRLAAQTRLLADGLRRLASLRAAQQRWRESQELFREAIGIYELRLGAENPIIAPVLRDYAEALKHDGGSKAEIREVQTRVRSILGFAPAHS